MRVFISTGEASGDAYGSALAEKLLASRPLMIKGSGGAKMRKVGVEIVADSTRWGAISIVQSFKALPRALRGYYRVKRDLKSNPGLFIPIDFGYANIRLSKHARSHGWKVLYFVPPGSWRRDKQGKDLPEITDAVVTPFSWSADMLRDMGANVYWFGHPIKELIAAELQSKPEFQVRNSKLRTVAILPGSRGAEISENLPVIAGALAHLPFEVSVEFALSPTTDTNSFQAKWIRLSRRNGDKFTKGDAIGVLKRADTALVCSGTATLEAALCRTPMVVIYRLSRETVIEARLLGFKRPKFVALPNILLERQVVPELVHTEANPQAIASQLNDILTGEEIRRAQVAAFNELDDILGPPDAITRTAELVLSMLETPN